MTHSLFSSMDLLESYPVSILKRQIDASLSFSFQTAASTQSSRCMWENSTRNWWKPALNLKRNKEKAQLMFGGCLMMEVNLAAYTLGSRASILINLTNYNAWYMKTMPVR